VAVATLDDLVSNLGIGVLDVAAAPAGVDVEVGDLVIYDPSDPVIEPGALVLGVGLDPQSRAAGDVVAGLANAGAVGVVVRGDPAPLLDVARTAHIALLAVPPEMAWAQLHTLLRTARAAAGQSGDASGGAPVGDLFALANAVAAMVGGPSTIEDMQSTVLAYSSLDEPIDEARRETILGHRIPDDWIVRLRDDGIFRRLYTNREPMIIDYRDSIPGFNTRLAVAIRAGDEVLGSIWVADAKGRGFGPEAEAAIKEAADLAALHLLRSQAAVDLERRRRSEVLRAALEGRAAPEALSAAADVSPAMTFTTVAFELLDDNNDQAATTVVADRAVNLIALHCEAYRRQAVAVAIGPVVHVLLPEPSAPDRRNLVRFIADLVERTSDALRVGVRAAVGASVGGIGELVRSHDESVRVLRALRDIDSPSKTVATVDDVRSRIVLLGLQDAASRQPELREGKVALLAELDAEKQTSYVDTLRAYLDHFGDVPTAAEAIHVHPNTFRYRLRRLVELADLNLDDPAERLVAHLQLMLLR
jgi:sugar diacid utilization regulator